MNIMEKDKTYKVLMIISDVLIAFLIFSFVLSFVVPVIISRSRGAYDGGFYGIPGAFANIFGFIYGPLLIGAILVILLQLRKIFISISGDKPFEMKNIVRVRSIGYALLILGVLKLSVFLVIVLLQDTSRQRSIFASKFILDFFQFLFAGFIILVVAEVFRLGVEMYNENKLTI